MKKLLAVLLLLCTTNVFAAGLDVGYFFCTACLLNQPVPDPDTNNFIHTIVNQYTGGSWQDSQTAELKHVEICNSNVCVTWQYTGAGSFVKVASAKNDGSHKYKNPPSQYEVKSGGPGGGTSNTGGGTILLPGGTCVKSVGTDPTDGQTYTDITCPNDP